MSSGASTAQPYGWVGAVVTRLSSLVPRRAATADRPRELEAADESLFEGLQDVLRIAVDCPPGESGDGIRRGACELIEAHSPRDRSSKRRRLLSAIARVQERRLRGRSHRDDPSAALLHRLSEALRRR
jgi:hypothetical protein